MGRCETCGRRDAHYIETVAGLEKRVCNVCALLYQYGEDAERIFRLVRYHESVARKPESR